MAAKKILILGVTGMLGHILFKRFNSFRNLDVYATVRSREGLCR